MTSRLGTEKSLTFFYSVHIGLHGVLAVSPVMAAVRERTSSRIRFSLMSSEPRRGGRCASTSRAEGENAAVAASLRAAESSDAATDSGVPKKSSS